MSTDLPAVVSVGEDGARPARHVFASAGPDCNGEEIPHASGMGVFLIAVCVWDFFPVAPREARAPSEDPQKSACSAKSAACPVGENPSPSAKSAASKPGCRT